MLAQPYVGVFSSVATVTQSLSIISVRKKGELTSDDEDGDVHTSPEKVVPTTAISSGLVLTAIFTTKINGYEILGRSRCHLRVNKEISPIVTHGLVDDGGKEMAAGLGVCNPE